MTSRINFIKAHKAEIDSIIRKSEYTGTINNNDRFEWIMNNEYLYDLAKSEHVNV